MNNTNINQDLTRDAHGEYHRPDGTFANRFEIAAYAWRTGTLTAKMTVSVEIVKESQRRVNAMREQRQRAYVATQASARAAHHAGHVLQINRVKVSTNADDKTRANAQKWGF